MVELIFNAKVIEQNRITIPKATRDILNIKVGDSVTIHIERCDVNGV